MGYPSPNRSGTGVVAEGFPPGAYDDFRLRIWTLGWLLMPKELMLLTRQESRGPLAPATLVFDACVFDDVDMSEMWDGSLLEDLGLEMRFRFGVNRRNKTTILGCMATLSTVESYTYEPYEDEDWELWDSRSVDLDSRRQKVRFNRSVSIRNDDNNTRIAISDLPRRRNPDSDLAALRDRGLERGMYDDYRRVLRGLDGIIAGEFNAAPQVEDE